MLSPLFILVNPGGKRRGLTIVYKSQTEQFGEHVIRILKNVDITKSAGIDNVSATFLKDSGEVLASPIAQLCNLSISTSSFLDSCKTAKLFPLYTKGCKADPKNYRPISLLPIISKVIEKIIHVQTQSFLDENNILYNF